MASLPLSSTIHHIYLAHTSPSSTTSRFFPNAKVKLYSRFSCKAQKTDQNTTGDAPQNGQNSGKIERRNVLLGMGGLYGATTLTSNPFAFATPVSPDFSNCTNATETQPGGIPINCCPPSGPEITDFVPPAAKVYPRTPAHMASETYIKQYSKAITKMKNLGLSDPRNFYQQANVHCAYCDRGYTQSGYPGVKIDIHASWIFFPWHRMYLYFFERICQKLLDDDSFRLPFWQWDDPVGMTIPEMYNNSKSSLYDCLRDPKHLFPMVMDLAYSGPSPPIPPATQIQYNLSTMYTQMILQSVTPQKFFGKPLRGGGPPRPGAGSIESRPHNTVHDWTGDPSQPHGEDMGVLYAAGRDPIFYAHHGNIDRMWHIYNNNLGGQNITEEDWLNSSFIFYDEDAKPVRVKVQNSLDITQLGYTYPDLPLPWLKPSPTARRKGITLPRAPKPEDVFPGPLNKTIRVLVGRPKKSRSEKEKDAAEETLEIQGIGYDTGDFVKFDVYVNEDDPSLSGPDKIEFIGSFTSVAHGHSERATSNQDFALNSVLEELGADGFDKILVTLVPRRSVVTITGIQISYDTSRA